MSDAQNPFVARVGGVLSADIAVPDHERVVNFYSQILTTGDNPLWQQDLMNNLGVPIIGLGARTEDHADLPLQWMPHIQVADVAASAALALQLGGQELMHGKDDEGVSQWAVLQDPDGAAFGLIPVVPAEALAGIPQQEPAAPVGCIAWFDLTVPNAEAARDFYRQVVGWSVQDVEMGDTDGRYADFNMLGGDGQAAAGVCHARGQNSDLPPVWILYLPVGDLAESVRRVSAEGGQVIKSSQDMDSDHAFAVIQDPVGAHLALVPGQA